jgi:uncharacterized glyoxalase superfamily protein PhnB
MTVKPIPDGYHTLTPYLTIADAAAQIDFLTRAFDAKLESRHERPDGSVGHAQMLIGDSRIMLGQTNGEWPARPATLYMYTEEVDALYRKAVAAGGKSLREPTNEFYGDRSAGVEDSQGNQWWLATHVEDVSDEELHRRAKAAGR